MSKTIYHFVYNTYNPINNHFYIGKHTTDNLNDNYQGSGYWVKRSLKKNNKLITKVIKFCKTENQACLLEEKLIKKYFNHKNNKNFKRASIGWKKEDFSKEFKIKISLLNKLRVGQKNPMYGKKHTEETIKVMKLKRAKQIFTKETNEKRRVKLKGLFASKEHRKKISDGVKIWHINNGGMSEEIKRKISRSMLGRKLSEEHKKNISLGVKKYNDPHKIHYHR